MNREFDEVRLSYREKQSFHHHLAQLLRSGIPFPSALDKLAGSSRGAQRVLIRRLRKEIAAGATIGEAFAKAGPGAGKLEASVIAAVEHSGRLEHGFRQLSESFGALARARATVIRKSLYPLFVLHFAIFALALPRLFSAGVDGYLRETGTKLLVFYLVLGVLFFVGSAMRDAGSTSAMMDRLLRSIPLFGKVRRSFALARFFLVYDLQLDAGVNVMDALTSAGEASRSGLILGATRRAISEVRRGSQVGAALADSSAFPPEIMQTLIVAEETGELSRELPRLAVECQEESLRRLESSADLLAKLIYTAMVLYVGWGIIGYYLGLAQQYQQILGE